MPAADSKADALNQSRALFANSYALWAMPLVNFLESHNKNDAWSWTVELYERFLHASHVRGSTTAHSEWLIELRHFAEIGDTKVAYLEDRLLQIWHNDPMFNAYERGISRLFTAIKDRIRLDDADYRRQVGGAIGLLALEPNGECDSPSVHAVILSSFEQLTKLLN